MKRVGIMVTLAQASRLSQASKQTEISVSELIRKLIDSYLVEVVNQSLDTNLKVKQWTPQD